MPIGHYEPDLQLWFYALSFYSSTTMRDQPDNITAAESTIFGTALVSWEQIHYAVQVSCILQ